MKQPRQKRSLRRILGLMLGVFLLVTLIVGVVLAFCKAKDIYLEQCLITDPARQVDITAGNMVKAGVIAEGLGLVKGANLAQIDFSEKRRELLHNAPSLREIFISRRLPDRIVVKTEERTPIARMGIHGVRKTTGRVTDEEGVVFFCYIGTQQLPIIREKSSLVTGIGKTVEDRSAAAVEFLRMTRRPEFTDLTILEIDTCHHDFLSVTLGDYSTLKICWEDEKDLHQRLVNLLTAIHSNVSAGIKIWNATIPDRIFADTQEKL